MFSRREFVVHEGAGNDRARLARVGVFAVLNVLANKFYS
jgi:hypothetical protein